MFLRLDQGSKNQLYLNYTRPTVEFGNVIYNNCCVADSIKLDQLQRKAAVICTGAMKLTETCNLMRKLNWESLKIRRDLASLNITYKILHALMPLYLSEHIEMISLANHATRLSLPERLNIKTRRYRLSSSQNSFFSRSSKLWNELPLSVKQSTV